MRAGRRGKKKCRFWPCGRGKAFRTLQSQGCLSVARHANVPDTRTIKLASLDAVQAQGVAEMEREKGLSGLVATEERRLCAEGGLQWIMEWKLERYSSLFKKQWEYMTTYR